MKKFIALIFGSAFLLGGCSISAVNPSPSIPVTGKTLSAPTVTVTPLSGSALAFDGQDDYIMVEDDPSLDLQNSFTITAWIYLEDYTEWASIVTKGDKPNTNNYAVQQSGPFDPVYKTEFGKLRFSGCTSLSAPLPESKTTISLRKWNLVAVTFDGQLLNFYWNGRQDGSSEVQGPLCTNDAPLYIAVDFPLTTEYWRGAIDELKIWNVALSDAQIKDLITGITPLETELVGYWTFDEGAGSVAHDRSAHANDGILVGDPVWIHPGAPIQ